MRPAPAPIPAGREWIPLTDVAWQHQQVWDEIEVSLHDLLVDPNCDGAGLTRALELDFEAYFGPGWEAIGTQSGLAAQTLLLRGYGIGPGDEVITVPNSDLATTAAISHVGARFVLADVGPDGFNLDPAAAERRVGERTRAIVAVHMYGHPADMTALRRLADRHGLLLLEDATLALGARFRGAKVGTLGDGAFFSFAPRKVLGGLGNGGMALCNRPEVARRVRTLRGYGLDPAVQDLPIPERNAHPGQLHVAEGYNLKLDGAHAAVVAAKFRRVDAWRELRAAAAARYHELLSDCPGVIVPAVRRGDAPAWRNYTILVEDREELRAALAAAGIASGVLYAPPVHLQPVYRGGEYGPGDFPVAEALAGRLLCLPLFPGISRTQVERVALTVRRFRQEGGA